MMEICLVPRTSAASQYPGIYLFTTVARMMRPVWNYSCQSVEMIGSFEQVYLTVAINDSEAQLSVSNVIVVSFFPSVVSILVCRDYVRLFCVSLNCRHETWTRARLAVIWRFLKFLLLFCDFAGLSRPYHQLFSPHRPSWLYVLVRPGSIVTLAIACSLLDAGQMIDRHDRTIADIADFRDTELNWS